MRKHQEKKKRQREQAAEFRRKMFPRRFVQLYKCNDCSFVWAYYKSKWASCGNCSSEDYNVLPGTWQSPFVELVPDGEKS